MAPERKKTPRSKELSKLSAIREDLLDIHKKVEKGFIDQFTRTDDQIDFWDVYNCKLSSNQFYNGNAKVFVPIVKTAVDARVTRFVNQLFPQTGRYVEVISENGDIPHAPMALAEHYVRTAKLKTLVAPALIRNGDVEGHYSVYCGWSKVERHVVRRAMARIEIDGEELMTDEEVEALDEEVVLEAGPYVEVISDPDLCVLPATANTIDEALEMGGSVTVQRRWSKGWIRHMVAEKEIRRDEGESLLEAMKEAADKSKRDMAKEHVDAAGIKNAGAYALIYETWVKLEVDGKKRLCRAYFGGSGKILGARLNPYWCDLCPVISVPRQKINNAFKGISALEGGIKDIQYAANDAINEALDSATYSLLPIVATDPGKNPKVGTMVMDLAAVWEVDPQSTKFMTFPQLFKEGFEIVGACKNEIFQALSVNPAMIPQSSGRPGQKRNQAEIANEQQVDILTTADAVGILEEGIFSPIVGRFIWYDQQFRDKAVTIKMFGRLGKRAEMQTIDPLAMDASYQFLWYGAEAARNQAQMQQQIAGLNVLKGIPPQLYQGRRLDLVPIMERWVENLFGPRLAPLIFKSLEEELSTDPGEENEALLQGLEMPVSPMDDDKTHLQVHGQALTAGDPHGTIRVHMMKHAMQMQAKAAQAQAQQAPQPQGQPGSPGGTGPGAAGTPPGAMPMPPKPRGPPGAVHPDQMPGGMMPRRM